MEIWLWTVIGILCIVIVILVVKIHLLRKSAIEIKDGLSKRLAVQTNTLTDISSHDKYIKQLAACINSELRKLRQQRRLYQHGDLELKEAVSNISHDLRTPLTAICGYLDLLKHEEKSAEVNRYLLQIENRTEVLKRLTEELFRYSIVSSIPKLTMESVDLCSVLEQTLLSFYDAMQQKGITPCINLPPVSVQRTLDCTAITRVFNNIISNALKYSDGDLYVSIKENGEINFINSAKDLDPVSVGKLFDRFYTVESGTNATGLGLSIAKLLTERMGGSINADYHDGKLFITVFFPN